MRQPEDIRVRAGDLKHPITIQALGPASPPTFGPSGGPQQVYTDFLIDIRAQIQPARAVQVVKGGQIVNEMIIPISVRYDPRILANMRVKFKKQIAGAIYYYLITGIPDADERGVLIEMETVALGVNL